MILTYEARDAQGRPTRDTIEAADTRQAVEELRRRGLYVTSVAETSKSNPSARGGPTERSRSIRGSGSAPSSSGNLIRNWSSSRPPRLPLKTVVLLTRQMAMLLRAGSTVVPAVAAIRKQMQKPAQAALLEQIVSDLEDGTRLTDALRKHPGTFDPVYCAVIAAGESSGMLTEMFERLSVIVGKRRALRNKIIGTLAYPALLMTMSGSILFTLLFFVIPRFNDLFTQLGVDPPATTKIMVGAASLLRGYWLLILIVGVPALGAAVGALTGARGRQWLCDVQLSVPLLGRLRSRLIQGQVFRTLGMLLESGVGVLDTLELVRKSTRNRRYQKLFDDLEQVVTTGGRLSTAFEQCGLVEPYVCQAIYTGEDTGSLGGAMTYCADILDETNTELINTVMRLIEPIILIAMGLVVGTVVASLFIPLFDLTAAM